MSQLLITVILFLAIFALLGVSEFLHKKGVVSAEFVRKLVHVGVGTLIFIAYPFFKGPTPILILSGLFVVMNAVNLAVGAFRGMEDVDRESIGTVLYPLSVFFVTLFFFREKIVLFTSLSALFYGDAFAAIVGKKYPIKVFKTKFGSKSLGGSLVVGLLIFLLLIFWGVNFINAFVIAFLGVSLEAGFFGGIDNLTLPLGLAFIIHYLPAIRDTLAISGLLAFLIAIPSIYLGFLTFDGGMVTFVLGTLIFAFGGLKWALPILTFFLTSSILTKLVKGRSVVKSGEARDSAQVLANGGLPLAFLIFNVIFPSQIWYVLYVVSLAVVNSDTWSTEIGTLSRMMPRSIVNFRVLPKGSSGAVSPCGSFGGLLGSFIIAAFLIIYGYSWKIFVLAGLFGFLGNVIDSILGATVEIQYKCPKCGGIFDVDWHCGIRLERLRGIKWFGNNMVNFTASLAGSLIAGIILLSIGLS